MTIQEYFPVNEPAYALNWIAPAYRNPDQMRLTGEFHEQIGTWSRIARGEVELPDISLDYDLEIKATGGLLPRPHQLTGCCVGVGGQRSYANAICGDVVFRGDVEDIKLPFALATYGVGREIAGMRGRGEGSFGAAQAKAVQEFGILPIDYPGLPTPTITNGWIRYTEQIELQWSHPSAWPIPRTELQAVAKKYGMENVTQIKSIAELLQAKAQGYGVTMASNFGTRGCHVQSGVLMADWDGSWAHQMSVAGFWRTSPHGLILAIDNQWNDTHGECPKLGKLGVRGSFWITERSMARIIQTGEVYAHTGSGGFPLVKYDWSNLGIVFV